jgi:signal transduction histidine kinase
MLADKAREPRRTPHAYAIARMAGGEGTELAQLREEVRRLGEELEQARERERRRIAREMHDSTVQDLVAIGLMLRRLESLVGRPGAKKILNEARSVLATTQQDLRTLSYLLHPPVLDDEGLVVALRSLIRGLASRMSIRVDLSCDVPPRTSPALEHQLYRVVQEALINVHKHADATRVQVRFFREGNRLILEVEDDGVGLGEAGGAEVRLGVGIRGMHQRIEEFGGTVTLASEGQGLLVRAEVPVLDADLAPWQDDELLLPIMPWKEGLP